MTTKCKRVLTLLLAGALSASMLTACGGGTPAPKDDENNASDVSNGGQAEALPTTDSDMEYVKGKGSLVIGITDFDPMDYHEENSADWVGFDADLAKTFAEELGVTAEFIEIDWDNKLMELETKAIDAVWNGMTLTDEVKNSMNCSMPYCENVQVAVVPKEKADQYADIDSLKDMTLAVEAGSAGAAVGQKLKLNIIEVGSQKDAMMEASSGASDGCIVDRMMAVSLTGEGDSYDNLTYTVNLNEASGEDTEHYVVGFRKDSDLTDAFNEFYKTAYEEGAVETIAQTYGVQDAVLAPQ